MGIKYYADLAGNYIGAFNDGNPNIPADGIEIHIQPDNIGQIWNGNLWQNSSIPNPNDVQSGRSLVNVGEEYIISINFQSIIKNMLDLSGDLIVDGQLFMEA